jgi:small subunit ribosomal protein S1
VVKNITDYGAFVDLGGIDGLLHVTDMAWRASTTRKVLNDRRDRQGADHPHQPGNPAHLARHEAAAVDPWEGVEAKYPVGAKSPAASPTSPTTAPSWSWKPGIEGLVHVSEMSWTKKNVHPGKIVSTSQEVDVMVLEVDSDKRRISLGLKQTQRTRGKLRREVPGRFVVEGEVKNITEFGLFVGLDGDIDGMVHLSDIAWGISGEDALACTARASRSSAIVLDVDVEKERISLGMKQRWATSWAPR